MFLQVFGIYKIFILNQSCSNHFKNNTTQTHWIIIAEFYNIVVPLGSVLETVMIIILLYNLIVSFSKQHTIPRKMKMSSSLIFIFYGLYNVVVMASRIIIPSYTCWLRVPLLLVCYYVTRATLYYIFIVRIEESFLSTNLMKSLRIFDIIFA